MCHLKSRIPKRTQQGNLLGWPRPDKLSQLLVTICSSRKDHDMQLSPSLSSQLVRDLGAAIVGQAGHHKPLNSPPH